MEPLSFTPSRLGPIARRGPPRGQRHRVPRPVRALLRRGRARLRGGRRRGRPQRADPVDARPAGRPRDGRWTSLRGSTGWSCWGAPSDDDVIADLVGKGLPVVVIARDAIDGADSVNAENAAQRRGATSTSRRPRLPRHRVPRRRHVVHRHHRSAGPAAARAAGSRRKLPPRRRCACSYDEHGGRRRGERLLLRKRPPEALVCANDEIALGAITAAEAPGAARPRRPGRHRVGRRHGRASLPARPHNSSTAHARARRVGRTSAARTAGGETPVRTRHEVLPTQLVVRASCGHHNKEDR